MFGLYDKGYSLIDIYHFMYEYIKVTNHPNKYIIIEKLCSYIQYIYDGFDNKIMLMFFTNDMYNIQWYSMIFNDIRWYSMILIIPP